MGQRATGAPAQSEGGRGEAGRTGRRAQADRRADSDRRMLRAAISLIAAHGSKGVSMAQIGTAAGYSRGLPAERFGTKLRLLEAVVDATEAYFERRLGREMGGRTGLEAVAHRIALQMASVRDSSEAAVALYQLIAESMGTVHELKPRITRLNRSYREGFLKHLREAEAAGELRPGVDLERHAMVIVSALHGLAIQALIDGEESMLTERAGYLAEVILAAIAAGGRRAEGSGPAGQTARA